MLYSSAGFCAKGGATKAVIIDGVSLPVAPHPDRETPTDAATNAPTAAPTDAPTDAPSTAAQTEPPVAQSISFSLLTKADSESGCCRDANGSSGIELADLRSVSIDKCKQHCAAEPKCNGFEYHAWSTSCEVRRPLCLTTLFNSISKAIFPCYSHLSVNSERRDECHRVDCFGVYVLMNYAPCVLSR